MLCVRVLSCELRPFKKQLEKESPWEGRQGLGAALGSCGALGRRCRGWQQELPCSPRGQRLLGAAVSDSRMNFFGIRGGQ